MRSTYASVIASSSSSGGCHVGMPVRKNDKPGSGCSRDCLHRSDVQAYREARLLDEERRKVERENATGGHATEVAEWNAANPGLTFRVWLQGRGRTV